MCVNEKNVLKTFFLNQETTQSANPIPWKKNGCFRYEIKLHLVMRLKFFRSVECGVPHLKPLLLGSL